MGYDDGSASKDSFCFSLPIGPFENRRTVYGHTNTGYWRYEGNKTKKGMHYEHKKQKRGCATSKSLRIPYFYRTCLYILWAVLGGNGKRFLTRWGPNEKTKEHQAPQSQAIIYHLSLLSTPQTSRWTLRLSTHWSKKEVFNQSVFVPVGELLEPNKSRSFGFWFINFLENFFFCIY